MKDLLNSYDALEKQITAIGLKKELEDAKKLAINTVTGGIKNPFADPFGTSALIDGYIDASQASINAQGLARYVNGVQTNFEAGLDSATAAGARLVQGLQSSRDIVDLTN